MKRIIFLGIVFILLLATNTRSFAATRSLYIGLSGTDVRVMQSLLISKGYLPAGKNAGTFGPLTDSAIKKFQCDQHIVCSGVSYGVYGPKTQAALSGSSSGVAGTSSGITSTNSGPFEFSGWIPYWRAATGTADTLPHLSQLKSIMPFGYTIHTDGTLADTADITSEPWTSFIAAARAAHTRVIPSVMWGDGDAIHETLSNATSRIALEDEIANTVKTNGFDGIDIDFEAKKHETIDYFSTFLKGLYARMGSKWVYCTIEARMPLDHRYSPGATIPADATDYANDFVQLNKYCDRVEIMAYDQGTIDVSLNRARSAPYAPVADPGWVENLVTLAAKDINKNKIIIGVPTYGYEYTVTPVAGSGFQYKVLWPFNFRWATDIAAKLGITPHRTSANEMGFIYDPAQLQALAPQGTDSTQTQQSSAIPTTSIAQNAGSQVNTTTPFNYVTWSDAQAIADKVDLARRLGVRGIAVFKFDGGEDPAMWSVLK